MLLSSTTLTATADAYTNSGANAGTNFGTATDLRVGNDGTVNGTYNSFVSFDVSALTSNVGAAFLTLHGAETASPSTGIKVYDVTSSWTESGTGAITYVNAPAADAPQSIAQVTNSAADFKFDVSKYVADAKANGLTSITFEVTQDTANGYVSGYADFNSREATSGKPTLAVYTNDMVEAPTADAYVDNTIPTGNFGSDTDLLVGSDSGEVSNALLSFSLSSVQGTPTNSYLHLWADALWGQDIGVVVKPVTGSWTESGVTWNNAPAVGSSGQYVIVGDGTLREYTLDVSGLVSSALAANATHVDFELQETAVAGVTNSDYIEFNSREASSNTPSLVLTGTPSVASAALAGTPTSITDLGTAAVGLNVLGADVAGEQNLTYTWAATSAPTGATVTFEDNGDNTAKQADVTFNEAGTYTFQATISDGTQSVTSSVTVTVSPVVTAITIDQGGVPLTNGSSATFSATATDQFGNTITPAPAFTWSVQGDQQGQPVGTLSGSTYTAPSTGSGKDNLTASASGVSSAAVPIEHGEYVGTVYGDTNGNGERGADETGRQGWQVYLDADGDGIYDNGDTETTTDEYGNYALPDAPDNSSGLSVKLVAQSGWTSTTATALGVFAHELTFGLNFGVQAGSRTVQVLNSGYSRVVGQEATVTVEVKKQDGTWATGDDVRLEVLDAAGNPSDAVIQMIPGVHRDTVVDQAGDATFKVYCLKALPAGQVLTLKATDLDDGTVDNTATFSIHEVQVNITTPGPVVLAKPTGTATINVTTKDAVTGNLVDGVKLVAVGGAGFDVTSNNPDITAGGGNLSFTIQRRATTTLTTDRFQVMVPLIPGSKDVASEQDHVDVNF